VKKILLSILFLIVFFCFPRSAFGANLDITVTINSVRIPERSAMVRASDLPNSEFVFSYGRIVVVNKNDSIVARSDFLTGIRAGAGATISFSYNTAEAPYNIHIEVRAFGEAGGDSLCPADCSISPAGFGGYFIQFYLLDPDVSPVNNPYCPWSSPCGQVGGQYMGVDSANVKFDSSLGRHYWRLPAIFCIDIEHPEYCAQ